MPRPGPLLVLAWRNLAADRRRLVATWLAVGFCVFLVIFQSSLLIGFLRAAERLGRETQADAFIVPRGVPCVEFAAQMEEQIAHRILGVRGVERVARGVLGFANWRTARGSQQVVLLVGLEPLSVREPSLLPRLAREQVAVDRSNLQMLELDRPAAELGSEVEINGNRARFVRVVEGFGSFMGSPYVFAPYDEARRWLGVSPQATNLLAVRTAPGAQAADVVSALRRRLPDVDVHDAAAFAAMSQQFWLVRTGAGGGILMAALLGMIVGAAILSQTLYAVTRDHLSEFVTLRAIGASDGLVRRVVGTQAVICGAAGWCLGTALSIPLVRSAKAMVPWIDSAWWLGGVALLATVALCLVASWAAVRVVLREDAAAILGAER